MTVMAFLRGKFHRLRSIGGKNERMPAHTAVCRSCGLHVAVPETGGGDSIRCPRCRVELFHIEKNPLDTPLAFSLAALMMMPAVCFLPYLSVSLPVLHNDLTLAGMIRGLVGLNYPFLAEVLLLLTVAIPLVFIFSSLYVYGGLAFSRLLPGALLMAKGLVNVRNWMMADVFFIATLVADIKLSTMGTVRFGAGFWCTFVLAVFLIRANRCISRHDLYYRLACAKGKNPTAVLPPGNVVYCGECLFAQPAAHHTCNICRALLVRRRPYSFHTSLAFLIAAACFYFPANTLPMMITSAPIGSAEPTILGGIRYMWQEKDYLVGTIIFCASIGIPVIKIVIMAVLLAAVRFRLPLKPALLGKLHHFAESIGRWSMIDIFVVIIMMSAFHIPVLSITAGAAAPYFLLVVLLTMLSAECFDSRLIWDRMAGSPPQQRRTP